VNYLSEEDVANYKRDGYIFVKDLFTPEEVKVMLDDIENGDGAVNHYLNARLDGSGRKSQISIWHSLNNDVWAAASTHPRIVNNIRILQGEDVAFFHGKVMLKEAQSGGAWEWHQDYGYWYDQGFVFPRMMSAFVALDHARAENGCLRILKGSHKLGRLTHGAVGDQTGADMERLNQISKYFEEVTCEMTPGTVLFFDSLLLHTSAPNNSDYHRRSFIICFNALSNPQFRKKKLCSLDPCPVGTEDSILKFARQPEVAGV
jgi:ectoine hydroxylase-related dioxygenase (phytanoyl-CoA dioxygenase family)